MDIKNTLSPDGGLQNLYSGGWNTSGKERFAKFIATDLDEPKLFLITAVELVDTDLIKFNVHVDGIVIPQSFHEGGSVLVEGKSIVIEQINEGSHVQSTWRAVQEVKVEFDSFHWAVDLSDGNVEPTLIASFVSPREFVLNFNRTSSSNSDLANMEVIIDGEPVRRDEPGKPLAMFLEGNSLIGKGKSIAIMLAKGDANETKKFSGSINLRKV